MMTNISSKHDKFVRKILSDTDTAIDYFQTVLPAHISEKLDLTSLAQQPGSYLSRGLEETFSDVIYTCGRQDQTGNVEVSLLLEHKSYPDPFTPVQIGGYLFSGYRQQLKQKRPQLSPIIPVLFYHGKEAWDCPRMDELFGSPNSDLLGYIPKYDYIYHNLTELPEDVIRAVHNQFFVTFF